MDCGDTGKRHASLPEWQERGYPPTVGLVLLPKALSHPTLFQSKFAPQCPPSDQNGENTAPLSARHRRAENGNEQSRVDGVTNDGVGTVSDQFMISLDGDDAAPVAPE